MKINNRGVTLLELMIVIAIVGILSAIALPAWDQQVQKSRRNDAVASLLELQLLQNIHFAANLTYGNLATIGADSVSQEGFYGLAANSNDYSTSFLATATATGSQANDVSDCQTFCLNQNGPHYSTSDGCAPVVCW